MNQLISNLNILLICLNVIGLASYLYSRIIEQQQFAYLLIIFIVSIISIQKYVKHIKCHFCLISTFSVLATFIKHQKIDLIIFSIAFAFSVNLGYALINRCNGDLKRKLYESGLNLSFSMGVIFSILFRSMQIGRITQKIIILATTLPNYYLSMPELNQSQKQQDNQQIQDLIEDRQQKLLIGNKLIYYLNPIFSQTWIYAFGYSIGIYLNTFQIFSIIFSSKKKNIKYLVIALFILIQTLTYKQIIKFICIFMRSIFVFHYQNINHNYQCYSILIYLILKNLVSSDAVNIYLMISYITISVIIWRQEYPSDNILQSNTIIPQSKEIPLLQKVASKNLQLLDERHDRVSSYQLLEQQSGKKILNQFNN